VALQKHFWKQSVQGAFSRHGLGAGSSLDLSQQWEQQSNLEGSALLDSEQHACSIALRQVSQSGGHGQDNMLIAGAQTSESATINLNVVIYPVIISSCQNSSQLKYTILLLKHQVC
jgi:hypothetical protein